MTMIHHTRGKAGVRVMRVHREGAHNEVRDLDVTTMLDGGFGDAWTAGDNHQVPHPTTSGKTVGCGSAPHLPAREGAAREGAAREGAAREGAERAV